MNLNTLTAYATILGTGVLIGGAVIGGIWRYWTWRQEHGTNVTVQISMGFIVGFGPNAIDAVQITVFNRSAHPIRVAGVGVEMNDGSKRTGQVTGSKVGADIPGIVNPHDSGSTWLETSDLTQNGFDVFRPARAFAHIADRNERLWSKRRTLMRRS